MARRIRVFGKVSGAVTIAITLAMTVASPAVAEWTTPALATRTLADHDFPIPADLPPRTSLLVIGFTRASRDQTSAWSRELARDGSLENLVAVYQGIVVEDVPALMRQSVVRGIRNSVPEALHDRFLVVTAGSGAWKALASYSGPDNAYLVLLDKRRKVRWQGTGEASASSLRAILSGETARAAVNASASHASRTCFANGLDPRVIARSGGNDDRDPGLSRFLLPPLITSKDLQ